MNKILKRHAMDILINCKFNRNEFSYKEIEKIDLFYDYLRYCQDINKVEKMFNELFLPHNENT